MEAHKPDEPAQVVIRRLGEIARQEQVAILYAAESGSRAWGFASPDSDYDVRFVYARAPAAYLSLQPRRDVIERHAGPDRLDIGGWDVAKALTLMLRANATLWEWLDSPVVYADDGVFAPAARRLFEDHASPRGLGRHYLGLARRQLKLLGAGESVPLKKYFYVVRPLLAFAAIEAGRCPPPMSVSALLRSAPPPADVARALDELLARKRRTPELGRGKRIAALDRWIAMRLSACDPGTLPDACRSGTDRAERLFVASIGLDPDNMRRLPRGARLDEPGGPAGSAGFS